MRTSSILVALLLSNLSMTAQTQKEQPAAGCPAQPNTLRAMRNCYRPLLVFAPAMNDPHLLQQFNQLKAQAADLKSRDVLYVPVVPEGHNQPIPKSALHTASLSEDGAGGGTAPLQGRTGRIPGHPHRQRRRRKAEQPHPGIGEQLKQLIDSMPMRKREMKQ